LIWNQKFLGEESLSKNDRSFLGANDALFAGANPSCWAIKNPAVAGFFLFVRI